MIISPVAVSRLALPEPVRPLPFLNLVAADVRRLIQHWAKEIRASSRRLLQFRGLKRETWFRRNLSRKT